MNCQEFREKHCAFIDDTLPGIDLVRMQEHLCDCRCCSAQDSKVRKSLMLVRSLPAIEPSLPACDLVNRLRSRLDAPTTALPAPYNSFLNFKTGAVAMTLFSVMMVAYVSLADSEKPQDIIFPPVIASVPELPAAVAAFEGIQVHDSQPERRSMEIVEPEPESTPIETPGIEIFASASAGMPIWPTVILAEQTPRHMVNSRAGVTAVQVTPVGMMNYQP